MSQQRPPNHQVTLAAPPGAVTEQPVNEDSATMQASSGTSSARRLDAYIGQVFDGRYVLEEPLGEGGMGVVYKARHKVIDKRVAIKILRQDLAADAEMTERFLNEAKAASSIGNPHIVDISDFGRLPDGATYFVMEFLEGQALSELMTSLGVVPVGRIIHIAKQIARGLSAAHARGIVHRDMKPDNVMLITRGEDKDFAKVLDFGIAKVSTEAGKITRAGSVFGTPHYMSPEQAAGTPVDHRTDIYSFGVILYEMASGKVPFDADNFMGILTQHMYKKPVYLRTLVPAPQEIPVSIEAIVHKCLAKRPDQRYASMDALVADLERAERGLIPEAVQEMMARSDGFHVPADYFHTPRSVPGGPAMVAASPQLARKRPVLVGVLVGAGIMVMGVVGLLAWSAKTNRAQATQALTAEPVEPAPTVSAAVPVETAAAPAKQRVAIIISPAFADGAATVKLGTERLPKKSLDLAPDESATVSVSAEGFEPTQVTCNGSMTRCDVQLKPKASAVKFGVKPAPPTAKPPGPAAPPTAPPQPAAKPSCPLGQTFLYDKCVAL
jgi:eukaryotic-like serine/threonine-protein kinase